ncbi:MAG TPA: hypothetical protein VHE37_00060 [Nevskiaceae bacterium]|nr:hypothetical protein [Nevskiaceae bacterium]
MIQLRFSSDLDAAPADVWRHASSMAGVNHELLPLMRMTHPRDATDLSSQLLKLGQTAFVSTLLLFGLLPADRHHLMLERLYPGVGFDERSWSWLQRVWIHRRRIEQHGEVTRITDELEFEPRLFFMAPLLRPVIRALFAHRHRRLRKKFLRRAA